MSAVSRNHSQMSKKVKYQILIAAGLYFFIVIALTVQYTAYRKTCREALQQYLSLRSRLSELQAVRADYKRFKKDFRILKRKLRRLQKKVKRPTLDAMAVLDTRETIEEIKTPEPHPYNLFGYFLSTPKTIGWRIEKVKGDLAKLADIDMEVSRYRSMFKLHEKLEKDLKKK
jgi:hypothetical protein